MRRFTIAIDVSPEEGELGVWNIEVTMQQPDAAAALAETPTLHYTDLDQCFALIANTIRVMCATEELRQDPHERLPEHVRQLFDISDDDMALIEEERQGHES